MPSRLYFPATGAPPVTPAFETGWNYNSEASRVLIPAAKGTTAITIGTQIGPWADTAGQKALDRQNISLPLQAQTIAGTVKMQLMVREYAAADNVDQLWLSIRVCNNAGTAFTGTLLALGSYGPTGEFISNASHRNKTGADGDALSSLAVNAGDRLVVETGYSNSTTGGTPNASAKWGENATDLPEDETQTTDGAGWIEFSQTLLFQGGTQDGAVAMTATGTVAGQGQRQTDGGFTASAAASLSALGQKLNSSVLTVTATASLQVSAVRLRQGQFATSGSGTLASSAQVVYSGALAVSGQGLFTSTGQAVHNSVVGLVGTAQLSPYGQLLREGTLALLGVGSLTSKAQKILAGGLTVSGQGSLSLSAQRLRQALLNLSGTGSLSAGGKVLRNARLALLGSATFTPSGERVFVPPALARYLGPRQLQLSENVQTCYISPVTYSVSLHYQVLTVRVLCPVISLTLEGS